MKVCCLRRSLAASRRSCLYPNKNLLISSEVSALLSARPDLLSGQINVFIFRRSTGCTRRSVEGSSANNFSAKRLFNSCFINSYRSFLPRFSATPFNQNLKKYSHGDTIAPFFAIRLTSAIDMPAFIIPANPGSDPWQVPDQVRHDGLCASSCWSISMSQKLAARRYCIQRLSPPIGKLEFHSYSKPQNL